MFSAPVFSLGNKTLLEMYNYSGHTQPQQQQSNNFKISYSLIPDIFVWSSDFRAEQNMFKTSDFRDTGSIHLLQLVQNIPASFPVARNHFFSVWGWGAGRRVFELINKESEGKGSDGKGEKRYRISQALFPIIPRSCSGFVPIILSSRISLVSSTPR